MKITKHSKFFYVITLFFILHFLIVFSYLASGLLGVKNVRNMTEKYIHPIFEQNWSMFSSPGISNKYVLLQYQLIDSISHDTLETQWFDINKPLLQFNQKYYFSISQRLIKYVSGCINNIYQVAGNATNSIQKNINLKNNLVASSAFVFKSLQTKSSGYYCLRAYAKSLFSKLAIANRNKYQTVWFQIKIIDDTFPSFIDLKKDFFSRNNHTYTAFNIQYGLLF